LSSSGPGLVVIDRGAKGRVVLDAKSGEPRSPVRAPATDPPALLAFSGSSVAAFAPGASPGKLLWTDTDVANNGRAFSEPVFVGNGVYLLKPRELVLRDASSGRALRRWPLPRYLEDAVRFHVAALLADDERFTLLGEGGFWSDGDGVIMTGRGASDGVEFLYRPMPSAEHQLLLGDTLVLFSARLGAASAYDLTAHEPPLASLGAEGMVKAVLAETPGDQRPCGRLARLPGLGRYWLEVAAKPSDPLWVCALLALEGDPQPGAGALFRRLAQNPPKSASDVGDPLGLILRVLAADDELATSQLLSTFARRAPPHVQRDPRFGTVGLARQQHWRTGRTSQLGFCPVTERSRKVPELVAPPGSGGIGTPHPLIFIEMANDGSWCLVCQARTDTDETPGTSVITGFHGEPGGDELHPYLVVGSGAGWTFDEFIASDPKGRYLAVREGACLSFVDTRAASVMTVPNADLRDQGYGPHRGAAFDVEGKRALYLRSGAKNQIVIRDLASGNERSLDPGPGLILSARFDARGQWLEVEVLRRQPWLPPVGTTAAPRHCSGPAISRPAFSSSMTAVTRLLPLGEGAAHEGADILAAFEGGALVRKSDWALVVRNPDGGEKPLVPGSCQGHVLHVDASRGVVIVACAPEGRSGPSLWIFGRNGGQKLASAESGPLGDSFGGAPERVVDLGALHVDVEAQRIVQEPAPAPGEVRPKRGSSASDKGLLAVRGDGAVLSYAPSNQPEWHVRLGPLVWVTRP
jgi:hypothetical protein